MTQAPPPPSSPKQLAPLTCHPADVVLAVGVIVHDENPSLREMAKALGLPLGQVTSSKARLQEMGILKNDEWEVNKELLLHFLIHVVPFFWPADSPLREYGEKTCLPIHESINTLKKKSPVYDTLFDAIEDLRRSRITGDNRASSVDNIQDYINLLPIESTASSRKANYNPRKKKMGTPPLAPSSPNQTPLHWPSPDDKDRASVCDDATVSGLHVEGRLQPPNHDKAQVAIHGDVSSVEQPMDVRPEGESVGHAVLSPVGGLDVSRLDDGEGVLSGDGAGPAVGVEHLDPEDALAETRSAERGGTVALPRRLLKNKP